MQLLLHRPTPVAHAPHPHRVGQARPQRRRRREAISAVVGRHPRFLEGWAHLGETARDEVEAYADFRVGYHRGLDRLRANGWRGSGYVRWQHPENQGFLRCLQGLQRAATALGEGDEADRCRTFLAQLDPNLVEPD